MPSSNLTRNMHKKHKKLGSVVYEGKSTNDDQEKAKVINRFFASVGKHDGDTKVEVLTTSASGSHGQQEVLFLQPIFRSEVEMALKQTKVSKAAGLDGVHARLVEGP